MYILHRRALSQQVSEVEVKVNLLLNHNRIISLSYKLEHFFIFDAIEISPDKTLDDGAAFIKVNYCEISIIYAYRYTISPEDINKNLSTSHKPHYHLPNNKSKTEHDVPESL